MKPILNGSVKNKKKDDLQKKSGSQKTALYFIVLMGIVSLFGDITYEGARSITGPYLAVLGAGAGMVGLVAGIGEFIGYALRLASGYISDKTKAYWPITIIGYGMLAAIPCLGFTSLWEVAAVFIILERMGKGIRTPARDTILSHATKQVGRGFGFGLHEALDQIGAIIGPLIFSAVFFFKGGYRKGFLILWIPALLCIAILFAAKKSVSSPADLEANTKKYANDNQNTCEKELENTDKKEQFSNLFWIYSVFSFFSVAGFVSFQLISYHFKIHGVVSDSIIPVLYAVAMGADALVALIVGRAYDKIGLISLIAIPVFTIPIPLFGFTKSFGLAVVSAVLWGTVMGIHETVMRAAIADLTDVQRRGTAYGIFNTIYGGAWFAGCTITGILYDKSIHFLFVFVAVTELISIFVFFLLKHKHDLKISQHNI